MKLNLPYEKQEAIILLSILVVVSPLLLLEKGSIVIWLNQFYNPYLNTFFKYVTHLGTPYFYLIPFFIYLRQRQYNFVRYFLFGFLLQAILTYILKDYVFYGTPRPVKYLEGLYSLTFMDIYYNSICSFPSGHTATAFSLYTLVSLANKNRRLANIILFFSILVGVSRIYLIQHFFEDVYAGAILGMGCSFLTYFVFKKGLET